MIEETALEQWREYARFNSGTQVLKDVKLEESFWKRYNHLKIEVAKNPALRLYLTWAAIGLMTYGHIDVIESAISYIPSPSQSHEGIRTGLVSSILVELLPLPENLTNEDYLRSNPTKVRNWYQSYQSLLSWNNELHRFVI